MPKRGRPSKASQAGAIAREEVKRRQAESSNSELLASYRIYSGGTVLFLSIATTRSVSYPRSDAMITAIGIDTNHIFRFDVSSYMTTHRMIDIEGDIKKCIESIGSEYCMEHERAIISECKEEMKRIKF